MRREASFGSRKNAYFEAALFIDSNTTSSNGLTNKTYHITACAPNLNENFVEKMGY